jgi:hypothetical protein
VWVISRRTGTAEGSRRCVKPCWHTPEKLSNPAALAGAGAAIEKMQSEIQRIRAAFPELGGHETGNGRRRGRPRKAGGAGADQTDAEIPFPKRKARVQSADSSSGRPKRTMSPEARKRIGDAQRARWAKQRESGGKKR